MAFIPHPLHKKGRYYMEQDLYDNIMELPKRIERDKDVIGVIVGSPGEGKSTLGQQICYALDPTFDVNRIFYSMEDYLKFTFDLWKKGNGTPLYTKGKAVIHDEVKEVLSASSVATKRTNAFMKFLYENRQLNMYHFFLTGDFFDLPTTIATQRVMFTIQVHEGDNFDNGFFKFWNRSQTKTLFEFGKRFRSMRAAKYNFRGRFVKFYTVDETLYRKKKSDYFTEERYANTNDKKVLADKLTLETGIMYIIKRNPSVSVRELGVTLNADASSIRRVVKKLKVEIPE